MARIALEGVSKRFGETHAVSEVDLEIEDGELFVLVGPSGCGKSTLLRVIAGLEEPTRGVIRVDGDRVNELDASRRNMAMIFQSYALYPHMTVAENIGFPLRMAGRPPDEIERRVRQTAEVLKIGELLDRRPGSLSGGQRQRVAMGRAIVREPSAFLMDEPLSNLDARLRLEMRAEVARLQQRLGTTTVYVTHDQTEAMTLAHRLAVLHRGSVQQAGTPRSLYENPANLFVASFLGSPPMNLLAGCIREGRLELAMTSVDLPPSWHERVGRQQRRVVAGVRPEELELAGRREEPARGSASFAAQVDVVEWTGVEMLIHCRCPVKAANADDTDEGEEVVVRLPPASPVREGEEVQLLFGVASVHLFDADSGESILGPERRLAAREGGG